MYQNSSDDASIVFSKLLDLCLQNGAPAEIQVRSDALVAILKDFCNKLGIKLKKVKRLTAIDEAIDSMISHFG